MRYIMQFRLKVLNSSDENRIKTADNTYILALDGDVGFHPKAVEYLVDRMNRNGKVGSACGRIHPRGHGKTNHFYLSV